MNPYLALVLIASIGYFTVPAVRQNLHQRALPKEKYKLIIVELEHILKTSKYVTKNGLNTYVFWPSGEIGSVHYDGSYAAYITCFDNLASFQVTTMIFVNGSWRQVDQNMLSPHDFVFKLQQVLGIPASDKQKIVQRVSDPVPDRPPDALKI